MATLTIDGPISVWDQYHERFEVLYATDYPATFDVELVRNQRTGEQSFYQIVGTTSGIDRGSLLSNLYATVS